MTTGLEIVTKAMQKAGILIKSESPSSDEASDALDMLNDMLASWSTEAMLIYARVTESFTLSGGVASYTIGAGQTFNTVRPLFIKYAYVRNGTIDTPVTVIDDETYDSIAVKTTPGTPEWLHYDSAYPYGTIKLYPVPSTTYSLTLVSEKELTALTLAGTVSLPAGWKRALIYNLSLELSPEYGQEPSASVVRIAAESKGNIKATVMRNTKMDANAPVGRGFNILTGAL